MCPKASILTPDWWYFILLLANTTQNTTGFISILPSFAFHTSYTQLLPTYDEVEMKKTTKKSSSSSSWTKKHTINLAMLQHTKMLSTKWEETERSWSGEERWKEKKKKLSICSYLFKEMKVYANCLDIFMDIFIDFYKYALFFYLLSSLFSSLSLSPLSTLITSKKGTHSSLHT